MIRLLNKLQDFIDAFRTVDFLGPLALRIYLAPIFIAAGSNKLLHIDSVGYWFASLGIPAPELMAWIAALTEVVGGILLVAGLGVRWVAVPLMVTMAVAAATAHWENGWHVLPESELTVPWEWRTDIIEKAQVSRETIVGLVKEHGDYDSLTEHGGITILKNGIEFAATYFVMLLALFFTGAGNFLSADYWIARRFRRVG